MSAAPSPPDLPTLRQEERRYATGTANRLQATKKSGAMVNRYWQKLFTAPEEGKSVLWYNGDKVNVFAQAADLAWVHGEAYSAMLAARHQEGPAQDAADAEGYLGELCSYARTHLGCAILGQNEGIGGEGAEAALTDVQGQAALPIPDISINAYPGCSSGLQWDDTLHRMFGRKVPMYNVNIPFLWGNRRDSLEGEEWDDALKYLVRQLREMVQFIEEFTGKKFDWDELSRVMSYIKQAAQLRVEAMDLGTHTPAPASYWDWIASIAPVNFLPGDEELVQYFTDVKAEVQGRVARGEGCISDERYRLYFDGIMNWNNLGLLSKTFAEHGASVISGRYTHRSFWSYYDYIDVEDPLEGIAKGFLLCPLNHSANDLIDFTLEDCEKFGLDGIVFHVSRTCRAMTSPQPIVADAAQKAGLQTMMFEGDVADMAFFSEETLLTRLEAMLEAIDTRRARQR